MTRFAKLRRRGSCAGERSDGFVLLESIVTISLITVIMSALAVFFVNATASTGQQRAAQTASQVATTAIEKIRSVDASTLVLGRGHDAVVNQILSASTVVAPWLAAMDPAYDATVSASAGASATFPTTPVSVPSGSITYTLNEYFGWCYLPKSGSTTDCVAQSQLPANTATTQYTRAVVAISWTGAHCNTVSCTYVTSTLVSAADDPVFKLNQPLPAAPVVVPPGNQTSAVNDVVDLQLTVQDGTGVPPFTWSATGLPPGLTMNIATGHIVGQPTTTGTYTVTVTATDAFVRPASTTFTWTVLPELRVVDPGPQASLTGIAITPLSLQATGGAGGPYTWTVQPGSLPSGLTMTSAGQISGTPAAPGNWLVNVTVTDKTGLRAASGSFTWTVAYPPLAASDPGAQTSTVNVAITPLQLTASGGSGNYVWSGGGTLPAGLSMTSAGQISGTPTATGTSSVALTVSDLVTRESVAVTFTWTITAPPTSTGPGTLDHTEGVSVSVSLSYTCPNGPCTITVIGPVPGVGLTTNPTLTGNNTTQTLTVASGSGTVYLAGTIQSTAVPSGASLVYTPDVTITDADGATTSPANGSWTIYSPPTTSALTTLKVTETAPEDVPITYTCPNAPCTLTLTGTVPGLGLSATSGNRTNNTVTSLDVTAASGTVYISGIVQTTAVTSGTSKAYTVRLRITDADSISSATTSATWTAYTPPTLSTAPYNATVYHSLIVSQTGSFTCPVASCTLSITGAPSGVGIDNNTSGTPLTSYTVTSTGALFYVRGTVASSAPTGTYTVTVTITDVNGATATRIATWTVV